MTDFRYAQFCPLTRAVEILGERWTILILRELFGGPKRFSDLKSALNGVSPSVLTERLARLEERSVIARRVVPPSALPVYELDEAGRALAPLLADLTRWGMRFLGTPDPGDRMRPEWLLLGLDVFARRGVTESIGAHLRIEHDGEGVDVYVRGGEGGTTVSARPLPCDVTISASPLDLVSFLGGFDSAIDDGTLDLDGDAGVARRIPLLFDFLPSEAPPVALPADSPGPARRPRSRTRPAASRGRSSTKRTSTGGETS